MIKFAATPFCRLKCLKFSAAVACVLTGRLVAVAKVAVAVAGVAVAG
jgi:hypothetical protein